jgi:hypothetical protein
MALTQPRRGRRRKASQRTGICREFEALEFHVTFLNLFGAFQPVVHTVAQCDLPDLAAATQRMDVTTLHASKIWSVIVWM